MGNQASSAATPSPLCHPSAAFCHPSASFSSVTPPSSIGPLSSLAKVLLPDGRLLYFSAPIKALHLLLHHPHHCLCPADSLRHSAAADRPPSAAPPPPPLSLLPDDHLLLGQLYVLLPFDTFQSLAAAASKRPPPVAVRRISADSKHLSFVRREASAGAMPMETTDGVRRNSSLQPSSATATISAPRKRAFEFQRPYNRATIRRCRSWRPRLHAINEVHIY